jgi:hypothetical protein
MAVKIDEEEVKKRGWGGGRCDLPWNVNVPSN